MLSKFGMEEDNGLYDADVLEEEMALSQSGFSFWAHLEFMSYIPFDNVKSA